MLAASVAACGHDRDTGSDDGPFVLRDVTVETGLSFMHKNGAIGRRHLPETMGGGVAWIDYDRDGDPDLFLLQSGALPDSGDVGESANRLYRNDGGRFTDVTASSGAAVHTGYGQGVAAGDYDGDGYCDLYITNYGADVLLRNAGDGSFVDVTAAAGIDNSEWGTSAVFFDMDGDDDLDLYVANYVQFSMQDYRQSKDGAGFPAYPHPDRFRSAPDRLYRNDGGRFTEIAVEAGIADIDGKGLGVAAVDLDGDDDLDLYVANDSTPNFVYRNLGGGRFENFTAESNAGFNADGATEAGMGIAIGDVDGDLLPEIFVTNLDLETNTIYKNFGGLFFADETVARGLAVSSMTYVGFGTSFLDLDGDGDLDLLVGNGHIIDNIAQLNPASKASYRQPALLYENDGQGRFREVGDDTPATLRTPRVVRGLALCDYDGDGDLDVALSQNAGAFALLKNDTPRAGRFVSVAVVDAAGRPVPGARCLYRSGDRDRVAIGVAGGSYCVSSESRIVWYVAEETLPSLEVRWPSGHSVRLTDVATDAFLTVGPGGRIEAN